VNDVDAGGACELAAVDGEDDGGGFGLDVAGLIVCCGLTFCADVAAVTDCCGGRDADVDLYVVLDGRTTGFRVENVAVTDDELSGRMDVTVV